MFKTFSAYIKNIFDTDDEYLEYYIRDMNTYSNN